MTKIEDGSQPARQGFDAERSRLYRQGDEDVVARSDTYRHYGGLLTKLSAALPPGIDVLDLGCGSGRYFHCLRNVHRLVGVDLSPHMIEQAHQPIKADDIGAAVIELLCGDVRTAPLRAKSFDLIYSIGVYGEYAPLDDALLSRLASLLKPRGTLFITAVDSRSRVSVPETGTPSLIRRVARRAFPRLPVRVRELANSVLSPHYVSRAALEAAFKRSEFREYSISSYDHVSGWSGTHWDCQASM